MNNIQILSKQNYYIDVNEYIPEKLNKNIIAVHGFGGDKNSNVIVALANELNKYNIGIVSFDFPGHGKSTVDGKFFTVSNSINDLNSVEEYILQKYNVPIGIFATSYGSYITLLNIGKNIKQYSDVILRCPAIDMYNIFRKNILTITDEEFKTNGFCELGYDRKINITFEYYEELKNNNIQEIIKNLYLPITIIHGTEDDMAPIDDSIKFQNKFNKFVTLEKVYGADHRFKKEGELEKILDITKKHLLI